MKIQIVYGRVPPAVARTWFECWSCGGSGRGVQYRCDVCEGTGQTARGRTYTYESGHFGVAVGDLVMVPPTYVRSEPQIATVVALGSDYAGPLVQIQSVFR